MPPIFRAIAARTRNRRGKSKSEVHNTCRTRPKPSTESYTPARRMISPNSNRYFRGLLPLHSSPKTLWSLTSPCWQYYSFGRRSYFAQHKPRRRQPRFDKHLHASSKDTIPRPRHDLPERGGDIRELRENDLRMVTSCMPSLAVDSESMDQTTVVRKYTRLSLLPYPIPFE